MQARGTLPAAGLNPPASSGLRRSRALARPRVWCSSTGGPGAEWKTPRPSFAVSLPARSSAGLCGSICQLARAPSLNNLQQVSPVLPGPLCTLANRDRYRFVPRALQTGIWFVVIGGEMADFY